MKLPASLLGEHKPTRTRIKKLVRAVRAGAPLHEVMPATLELDALEAGVYVWLERPMREEADGLGVYLGDFAGLLTDTAAIPLEFSPEHEERTFWDLLAEPWGVLGLLGDNNAGRWLKTDQGRLCGFLQAVELHRPALERAGRRFCGPVRGSRDRVWWQFMGTGYALANVGVDHDLIRDFLDSGRFPDWRNPKRAVAAD